MKRIYNNEFAVAAVLLARLAPALFFGPLGGVIVDRFDRKKVMVFCDIGRAALISVLPFTETIGRSVPLLNPVVLLFVVSALLEMLTLLWQPAKDSTVPDMVRRDQLTHAYSLLLLAAYGSFPLSGAIFGLLAHVSSVIGSSFRLTTARVDQESLALFLDGVTFLASAIFTMTLAIRKRPPNKRKLDFKVVLEELVQGLRSITSHPMLRPWVIGIAGTFAGVGVFLSMALFFVSDVLKAGPASFGFLVTAVGTGLALGFVLAGVVQRFLSKDVLFSVAVISLGVALVAFGSVSTLPSAVFWTSMAGLFAGFAYPSGYALIQESVDETLRGRISAAVNSMIRLAVVGASAIAPALVKLIDNLFNTHNFHLLGQRLDIRGVRFVMWLGGAFILGAGWITTRAVRARHATENKLPGLFLVFEGGEGAGKSTQMQKLAEHLESMGQTVIVTREPGGTGIGAKIRDLLLDPSQAAMSAKAEALLYAADRAQHVEEVIRPALRRGEVVISDRYVDSSIAYQGLARGLGLDEIRDLSKWATEGLFPDLVLLLDFDASLGLGRSGGDDRIEQAGLGFHEKVREAYRLLAERHADRFFVIDGAKDQDELAGLIRARVEPLLESDPAVLSPAESKVI